VLTKGRKSWQKLVTVLTLHCFFVHTALDFSRKSGKFDSVVGCLLKFGNFEKSKEGAKDDRGSRDLDAVFNWYQKLVRESDDTVLALMALRVCVSLARDQEMPLRVGELAYAALHEAYPITDLVSMHYILPEALSVNEMPGRSLFKLAGSHEDRIKSSFKTLVTRFRRQMVGQQLSQSTLESSLQARRFLWYTLGYTHISKIMHLLEDIMGSIKEYLTPREKKEGSSRSAKHATGTELSLRDSHPKLRSLSTWTVGLYYNAALIAAVLYLCRLRFENLRHLSQRLPLLVRALNLLDMLVKLLILKLPKTASGEGAARHSDANAKALETDALDLLHPLLASTTPQALKALAALFITLQAKLETAVRVATDPKAPGSRSSTTCKGYLSRPFSHALRLVETVRRVHVLFKGEAKAKGSLPAMVLKLESFSQYLSHNAAIYHLDVHTNDDALPHSKSSKDVDPDVTDISDRDSATESEDEDVSFATRKTKEDTEPELTYEARIL